MEYCLDTNVLIDAARRYYAFDIAPVFWETLLNWAEAKQICSVERVYGELTEKYLGEKDPLKLWAKEHQNVLFVEPTSETYASLREIADWVNQHYESHQVETFLEAADCWVIAYAKAHHLSVVTLEKPLQHTRNPQTGKFQARKIAIPNVCEEFGVPYLDTFDMLRRLGFSFR